MTGYSLTIHAQQRMDERQITLDDLAAAFAGDCVAFGDQVLHYYSRQSRVRVIVNPRRQRIITVIRLTPSEARAFCEASRHQGELLQ